jgi:hypothetical protein
VLLGHHPIAVGIDRRRRDHHVRLRPARQLVRLRGVPEQIVALPGGLEAWRVSFEGARPAGLAFVSERGRATLAAPLPSLEPRLPSPSATIARLCAQPGISRVAALGSNVLALVLECHREAPMRLVRYDAEGKVTDVRALASAASAGFDPEQLAVAPDGPVVAGRSAGRLVLARPGERDSWQLVKGQSRAAAVIALAVGVTGAAWTLTLGEDDSGDDLWEVQCEGRPVSLSDPDGAPVRPVQMGADAHLGVSVLAMGEGGKWLFAETPLGGTPVELP